MRFGRRVPGVLVLVMLALTTAGCMSKEVVETRHLTIKSVDLASVRDGQYDGEYAYGGFTYAVGVQVQDHRIRDIRIAKNRDTKHAKMAEAVKDRILEQQKNDVDAVSGATTTSKAFLKAVEIALSKGL
jgi:uncharacterized protein with FMN-binding domain